MLCAVRGVALVVLAVLGALSLVVVHGFRITEVVEQVGLQGISFELVYKVELNRTDDAFDMISTVLSAPDGRILVSANASIFDQAGLRQTQFTVQGVMLNDVGKQTLTLQSQLSATSSLNPPVLASFSQSIWVIPGFLTLIPLMVTMVIAAVTRNVFPALIFGVLTACFLTYEYNLASSFVRMLDSTILTVLTRPDNQLVILFAMIMGGFVNMVNESQGSVGLANSLSRLARSSRSTQGVTLLFCALIFFDDYASALIAGATLRPIADKMGVSREKFCFLVDAGSASDAALIPITSWTSFLSSLLQAEADKLMARGINIKQLGYEESGFIALLRMLKYAYYSIFLMMFQIIIIASKREFGPMFLAERRALVYGVSDARYKIKTPIDEHENDPMKPPAKWYNAAIPIGFFVIYTIVAMISLGAAAVPVHETVGIHNIFANVDSITVMYYAGVLACFVTAILYRCQRFTPRIIARAPDGSASTTAQVAPEEPVILDGNVKSRPVVTLDRSIEAFVEGFTHLTSTIMVLVLAWSIGAAVDYLGAGRYIATTFQGSIPGSALPALIYAICCAVAFSTGTSWGTMALMFPICGPIAFILSEGNPELYYASMAAILEGAVFGDHCSFISDTTIMSASACRCPLEAHVITQIPYAFFVSLTCLFCGYIPVGMQTIPVGLTYVVGFASMLGGVLLLGANPEGNRLDLMSWFTMQTRVRCCGRQRETLDEVTLMAMEIGAGLAASEATSSKRQSLEVDPAMQENNPLRRHTFEVERDREERARDDSKQRREEHSSVPKARNDNPFDFDFNDVVRDEDEHRPMDGEQRSGHDKLSLA